MLPTACLLNYYYSWMIPYTKLATQSAKCSGKCFLVHDILSSSDKAIFVPVHGCLNQIKLYCNFQASDANITHKKSRILMTNRIHFLTFREHLANVLNLVPHLPTWLEKRWRQASTMHLKGLLPMCPVTWLVSQVVELERAPYTLQPDQRHCTLPPSPPWPATCTAWQKQWHFKIKSLNHYP